MMKLTYPDEPMSDDIRPRVNSVLMRGCDCGGTYATLTQRYVGNGRSAFLQCQTCGRAVGGGSMPKREFPQFDYLPMWNESLNKVYWKKREEESLADREQRQAEYHKWLETNPEWKRIRALVLRRSGGICEACLSETATEVHHCTYYLGWLPPAWELRAICRACHNRLHFGWAEPDRVLAIREAL